MRNVLPVFAYIGMVYWVGSDPGIGRSDATARLITNLYHIPLYAGLTFWVLRAVSRGQDLGPVASDRAVITFLIAGGIAVLDELHQVFVPFRDASLGDLLLDLTGIVLMLVVCGLGARVLGDGANHR